MNQRANIPRADFSDNNGKNELAVRNTYNDGLTRMMELRITRGRITLYRHACQISFVNSPHITNEYFLLRIIKALALILGRFLFALTANE